MVVPQHRVLSQLFKRIRAAFLVRVAGVGTVFVVQMLLARWFGAKVFGEYVFVFTWVTVLALAAKLGLDTASLRFVSAYTGTERWALLLGFVRKSRTIVLLISLCMAGTGSTLVALFGDTTSPGLVRTFQVGFLLLPCLALMQLHAAQIQALNCPALAQVPQDIVRPFLLLACAAWFVSVDYMPSAAWVMSADVLATFIGLLVAWVLLRRRLPWHVSGLAAEHHTREWLTVSLPMLLVSGAQLVLAKADILMVGAMVGPTEAGKYAAASLLAGLVTFLISTANQVIAPTISHLFVQERGSELQRMVTTSTLVLSMLTLPLVLVLVFFGVELLTLFGAEFADQFHVLLILMIGQVVVVLWGSVGFLLTMTEHQATASWVIGSTSILNVALNAIFIPVMGVTGAALATSLAVSLRSIVLGFFVWRKLNIMPTVFGPMCLRIM